MKLLILGDQSNVPEVLLTPSTRLKCVRLYCNRPGPASLDLSRAGLEFICDKTADLTYTVSSRAGVFRMLSLTTQLRVETTRYCWKTSLYLSWCAGLWFRSGHCHHFTNLFYQRIESLEPARDSHTRAFLIGFIVDKNVINPQIGSEKAHILAILFKSLICQLDKISLFL